MFDFLAVTIVQWLFIFVLDNKFRNLTHHSVWTPIGYQIIIASMYVTVIPLVAKGTLVTSLGYILGSVLGVITSYYLAKRKGEINEKV